MMEVDESLLKAFGCSPKVKTVPQEPKQGFVAEPWMADFVKERHHQHEWDAFFAYCEAGPTRRFLIRLATFFAWALSLISPRPVNR